MSQELALTMTALEAPQDLKGVFELAAFRGNFVNNYLKTTGRPDGAVIYEREKLLFMKAINDQPKLQSCTRFSVYSAFIELAASGLTLLDGVCYILPYGNVAQFQIGYKGRLEQINTIPGIQLAPEPQVVYTGDDFDYELGNEPKIIKHKPLKPRAADAVIEYVYLVLTMANGKHRLTLMDRATVLSRRDRYSKSYQYWKSKGGEHIGSKVTKPAVGSGNNGTYNIDPPFWVTGEEKAFKKTVVKEAYTFLPKTGRMKALDERIQYNLDPETGEVSDKSEKIDLGIKGNQETFDTTHEEVKTQEQQQAATPPPASKPALGDLGTAF
jgi:phage RecT family recombinase